MAGLSFERVQIDGFRGLRGLDLDGLGRVNILIGANDSGKTSVLEALSVVCDPYDPSEWLNMVSRRDFGRSDETVIQSLRWCFTQSGNLSEPEDLFSGQCEFACEGLFPLRTLAVAYSECMDQRPAPAKPTGFEGVAKQPNISQVPLIAQAMRRQLDGFEPVYQQQIMLAADLMHVLSWDEGASMRSFRGNRPPDGPPIALRIWEDSWGADFSRSSSASLACETLTPYSYQINSFQVSLLSKQFFRDDPDQTLKMLQGFDPDVVDVRVLSLRGDRPAIYVKHSRLGVAPLSVFGDAMRRCVLLAATLPQLKGGGVLLIDEVETGIHVKALQRVFQWLIESARQLNVQVFVTTHSLEALDAIILAPSAHEGDVVAFRLARTDASTMVKRFSGDLLLGLRQDLGLDLR